MSLQDMLVGAVKSHLNKDDHDDDDLNPAVSHASAHDSTDSSFFSQALSFVNSRKSQYKDEDIDESDMVKSHQSVFGGSSGSVDSKSLGSAAALQALKMFNSGSASETGGGDKNAFIGMAMAEAGKLFDQKASAGEASGDKQSAINAAAEQAFKMYMKSKMSGSSGTGGPSGLMSLASKFM